MGDRSSRAGARCRPIPARHSIAKSHSTRRASSRWSPGARVPRTRHRSPDACPTPRMRRAPSGATPSSGRWPTWACSPGPASPMFPSIACSSAPAPTGASRTCAVRPRSPRGRKVAAGVEAWVVPGSGLVKAQAEAEGLDRVFTDAGFQWRHAGLLDVPRDERRHRASRPALRVDDQPQFRRTAGSGRAHPPAQSGDGGGRGRDRPPDRRAAVVDGASARMKPFERLRAVALPIAQPNLDTDQIIPARYLQKLRADDFGRVPVPRPALSRGRRRESGLPAEPAARIAMLASSWPSATSAADRRASTPSGRCTTSGSVR